LISLGLDDDVPGAESHPVPHHLLVAAIEQSQRNQHEGETQTQRERGQQRSAGAAPKIAPPDLHQQESAHYR
jgi:hypothetical protein